MSYQLVASTAAGTLSDEEWMDLISLASKHGFSAPRLSLLGEYEEAYLTEEEAEGLYAALERALFAREPAEHIPPRTIRWTATRFAACAACYNSRCSRSSAVRLPGAKQSPLRTHPGPSSRG